MSSGIIVPIMNSEALIMNSGKIERIVLIMNSGAPIMNSGKIERIVASVYVWI
jgi:hypothetical protein